jgi:methionine sulfoxide reductase heme-binding subunit
MNDRITFQGWQLVGWSALAIAILVGSILAVHGIDEAGVRVAIRATARTSCILFLCAFVASSLRRYWPSKLSGWLVKNRRYLGVSLAVSHGFHALAIIGLVIVTSGATFERVAYNFGGHLGYIFLIAMTATSFNRTAAWLGDRSWHILHTVGMYYLWLAFTVTFSKDLSRSPIYLAFVALLAIALGLRLFALIQRRKSP